MTISTDLDSRVVFHYKRNVEELAGNYFSGNIELARKNLQDIFNTVDFLTELWYIPWSPVRFSRDKEIGHFKWFDFSVYSDRFCRTALIVKFFRGSFCYWFPYDERIIKYKELYWTANNAIKIIGWPLYVIPVELKHPASRAMWLQQKALWKLDDKSLSQEIQYMLDRNEKNTWIKDFATRELQCRVIHNYSVEQLMGLFEDPTLGEWPLRSYITERLEKETSK